MNFAFGYMVSKLWQFPIVSLRRADVCNPAASLVMLGRQQPQNRRSSSKWQRCSSRKVQKKKTVILLHTSSAAAAAGAVLSIKSCESFQPGNLLNFVTKPRAVRNYRGRQPSCTTACPNRFSHGSQSHCGNSKRKMKGKEHIVKN